MKTILIIIVTLLSNSGYAISQIYDNIKWEYALSPEVGAPPEIGSNAKFEFDCFDCLDKNNCIAIGIMNKYPNIRDTPEPPYERITFRTTDGGSTWRRGKLSPDLERRYGLISRPETPRIVSVTMLDSLIAIAVGDSGILVRTTNGGMTWDRILNAMSPTSGTGFRSVAFSPDRKTGIAVGTYGIISITADSGKTWDTKELVLYLTINQQVVSPANGVFYIFDGFYSKMFRTFDSGKTWDTVTVYKNWYRSKPRIDSDSDAQGAILQSFFLTPAHGWAVCLEWHNESVYAGNRYKVVSETLDSGKTWTVKRSEFTGGQDRYSTIAFANEETGMIGGTGGLSLFTAGGPVIWFQGPPFAPYNNPSIFMAQYKDPNVGMAMVGEEPGLSFGYNNIYRFRRSPLAVEEIAGWGSNPYFWIETAPLPASTTLRARLFGLYSVHTRTVTAKVYDILGNIVYDASKEATDGNNGAWSDLSFSVSGWQPGVYLLSMEADGSGFAKAFVVGR
jgi:photosystem II stability/assembly factor-like uncharacterized protein